jgi:hypothetical protein
MRFARVYLHDDFIGNASAQSDLALIAFDQQGTSQRRFPQQAQAITRVNAILDQLAAQVDAPMEIDHTHRVAGRKLKQGFHQVVYIPNFGGSQVRFVPDYNVPNRYNCTEMRNFFKVTILILFLLNACNFPRPGKPAPGLTVVPDAASTQATDIPSQVGADTGCGFVWAREPLADLSNEFDAALREVLPEASGYAEAYGENCLNNQGEVVRFLAMETDFYVTLKIENLEDKQALGELIEQVLSVVAEFPPEETPGPQPGYVGITFETPGEELRLWFTQVDAETALENGLRGEELFNALQSR